MFGCVGEGEYIISDAEGVAYYVFRGLVKVKVSFLFVYTVDMTRHFKKLVSLKHWLAFLRRQSKHMQHVYALTFAGLITGCIASVILYVDYGFWRDRYSRDDVVEIMTEEVKKSESPTDMFSGFLQEAKAQFDKINLSSRDTLDGKEEYTRDSGQ